MRLALRLSALELRVLELPAINGIPFFDLFLGSFFGHHQFSKEQYVKLKLYGFEDGKSAFF